RCVSGRADARTGARDRARQRIAVRAPAARQRDRQLHQGSTARDSQDCARHLRPGDAVAIGTFGGRHDSNEVIRDRSSEPCRTLLLWPATPLLSPIALLRSGRCCRPTFLTARCSAFSASSWAPGLRAWPHASSRWGSRISEGTSASASTRARGWAPRSTRLPFYFGR